MNHDEIEFHIRAEQPNDAESVYRIHYEAFGEREEESKMAERVRASKGYIPELSLIATDRNGSVIGHALFSQAEVVDEDIRHEVIVLAPIAVKPGYQNQGIGGALIREGLRLADKRGNSHVFLIGHPAYYPKFGFEPARPYGFELKQFEVPNEVFMVKILSPNAGIKGELRYPQAFLD
ncbi:GNAT family N-acetyltransferase [Paenibacillus glycanilyticus]|uniref:N-acetyltransferase n=1 Tax=Paenibacillus glycanilyticus TaxID=126569 RepID=A0ABQ6GAM3_9BACL|nr:N-acetyltransferase [Paenibacillus glycanilyticus]GLX68004.1 N-acetyltransferase [Paenibacillus glycanilyticus]